MNKITGATKLLAVIGNPITHSLSPIIQNFFINKKNLNLVYLAFEVTGDTLENFIKSVKTLDIVGFNVTMPLKEKIIPYLDGVDDKVKNFGAINTVVNKNGKLFGYNTDGDGFIESLRQIDFDIPKKAVILGSGGAAKTIAYTLSQNGTKVTIISRKMDVPNAREEVLFLLKGGNIKYSGWKDIKKEAEDSTLLVNATPLGMKGMAEDFSDFSFIDVLPEHSLVYDLVYAPKKTNFIAYANKKGIRTIGGMTDLVCQAALAFSYFTGNMPDLGEMREMIDVLN
jgi:shikimate dehydrogenase